MRIIYLTLVVLLFILVGNIALAQGPAVDGLVTVDSAYSVSETADRLEATIKNRGLNVVARLDHAANAQSVDQELRPTQLLIFGNPNLGTPLMQTNQTAAIDLPQKMLIWEDAAGSVFVSYNNPQYLVNRYSLSGVDEQITNVTNALANFAGSVSIPENLPVSGENRSYLIWFWLVSGLIAIGGGLYLNRRVRYRSAIMGVLLLPLLIAALTAHVAFAQRDSVPGLIVVDSPYSVADTVAKLEVDIAERGLNLVRKLDHAANAQSVDRELRPTQLLIFGNPNLGTPLMQTNQTVAIDLPQKMLIWEDEAGQVHIAYNNPAYLAERHAVTDQDEIINRVSGALAAIAEVGIAP